MAVLRVSSVQVNVRDVADSALVKATFCCGTKIKLELNAETGARASSCSMQGMSLHSEVDCCASFSRANTSLRFCNNSLSLGLCNHYKRRYSSVLHSQNRKLKAVCGNPGVDLVVKGQEEAPEYPRRALGSSCSKVCDQWRDATPGHPPKTEWLILVPRVKGLRFVVNII